MGPLAEGRIPRARGRVCAVGDGAVSFSSSIRLEEQPMIGCIGIGPAGQAIPCGTPGRHGGNLDHKVIGRGARVYLPVNVPGGLLWIGDVHATQGDGELSGTAVADLRIGQAFGGMELTLRLEVPRSLGLHPE